MRNTRQDPANTELGAWFSHTLLSVFRASHYRRAPHGGLEMHPWKPFIPRTEKTREAVSKRLGFFVSLPHGRGQRDRAINDTAQHFNVNRRTIERDFKKATNTLKAAMRPNTNRAVAMQAGWALSVLEGRPDKAFSLLIALASGQRHPTAGALCGLLSMSL
jgi:hypothetical protein